MNLKNKLGVVLLILCLLSIEVYVGVINDDEARRQSILDSQFGQEDTTITLWYTDDSLTDFLHSVALSYYEDSNVHVNLQMVSGLEYLENINRVSIRNGEKPDLYIVGNDSLGKAYLAGLAAQVQDTDQILTTEHYCQTALDAVTYEGKYVGYPMYFETSVLLYNATYLNQIAQKEVEAQWAQNISESDTQEASSEETDTADWEDDPLFQQEVTARAIELIPGTIDGILNFADSYDAPENVDAIFEWDVSDIFYNYFFVGNYVNVGGQAGDNPEQIDIYNEDAIRCLNVYQDLNQFFSIDADSVTYESVVQDFMDGKTVFTLVTSDAIATLEQAKEDGTFVYDYGVCVIPDLTQELISREVSYTNAVAVNGYSNHKEEANAFAKYLCLDYADSLYNRTGKIAASQNVAYENGAINIILQEYAMTVPMPKAVEITNFWIELEMCFTNVWQGDDANDTLRHLSEKIMKQITGQEFTEEYIEVQETDPETDEEDTGTEDDGTTEDTD